jgi:hypothetical protein
VVTAGLGAIFGPSRTESGGPQGSIEPGNWLGCQALAGCSLHQDGIIGVNLYYLAVDTRIKYTVSIHNGRAAMRAWRDEQFDIWRGSWSPEQNGADHPQSTTRRRVKRPSVNREIIEAGRR